MMRGVESLAKSVFSVSLTLLFAGVALPAAAQDAGDTLEPFGAPIDMESDPDQYRAVGINEDGEIISNIIGGVYSPEVDGANDRAVNAMGSLNASNAGGVGSFAGEPALGITPTIGAIAPGFVGRQVNF